MLSDADGKEQIFQVGGVSFSLYIPMLSRYFSSISQISFKTNKSVTMTTSKDR